MNVGPHKILDLVDLPGEEWMDVYGWDGMYHASNLGRIKSLSRDVRCGDHYRRTRERILRQCPDGHGLLCVSLSQHSVLYPRKVSQLVFEAFNRGPVKEGNVVAHRNKVKTDNRLSNLAEMSQSASNKLNYDIGVSTHRDIGSRVAAEADELDRLLITSPTTRICRICKRELPNKVFDKQGSARPHRACLDCRLTKRGVVNVGKQRTADELFAAGLRRCNPCGRTLPLTDFGPSRSSFGGRNHICPPCARAKDARQKAARRASLAATSPHTPPNSPETHRSAPEGSGASR